MTAQTQATQRILTLEPNDSQLLADLCGQLDENLKLIEKRLDVRIAARANTFQINGDDEAVNDAVQLIRQLYNECQSGARLNLEAVHLHLQKAGLEQMSGVAENSSDYQVIHTKKGSIKPRGGNQQRYVQAIRECDINFGIGPAGTGKTYLAVACAVEALISNGVQRILLVRPAVEAGEKLGFLPGDLAQKIDPYLRPLYDALYEMIGVETVTKLIERNVIEIAPLAYMRGRTLNDSYIILDEAQNTTREQMKMFLTRIGFGSTAVITGDATQIDLPKGTPSGLLHVMHVLKDIDGISMNHFESRDVVRHPLVQRIVEAYAAFDEQTQRH
ncbi:phosphate starvation-inducible protein PhoH, predicted ATPase [Spongiibacter sp. IMCC21906]|uniref:PhoH family protein n=1 Tax=Spongiibacter sp. IMCC21906 TaxID=1620392 RepID=UPI00062DD491|nr:PhoH family protein [Spongiibacter sp. IMCC21906]AKH70809.1 phosphate starvation-inducible protein PhoH, predicted ATPase [Spongiibacter sp. IMCC21906]